jgi:hypothetical protein
LGAVGLAPFVTSAELSATHQCYSLRHVAQFNWN